MPARSSYTQGMPNWVDLQTTDQDAAKSFYSSIFGWEYDDQPMPQGPTYSMAQVDGHPVAAIAPQTPEMAEQHVPPMWNTYLAVDDVDATSAKVEEAGGHVLMPPFDVMDAGRMAYVADPSGATVGLWQSRAHFGAALVNEPGTVTWNELVTDKAEAALPFYAAVVGLTTEPMAMGDTPYTMFVSEGTQVAGTMAPQMPGAPNHWHVYFAVSDADATIEKAARLGGTVLGGPFDTPVGRIALLQDPQGAAFSIM